MELPVTDVIDAGSTAGKTLAVRRHVEVLVIGAGPAGCAAACEAARHGLGVVLIDENPVDPASIGLDVPFHFGGRAGGALRNRGAMIERLIDASPAIGEAFEAGVDVQLGVAAWGLFVPRPGIGWIGRPSAGLTDGETSWFFSFDAAILATGRRDAGIAFPGWDLPGVMGVTAATHLLTRYQALDSRSIAVLGSGAEATSFAEAARAAGLTIAAMVEASPEPVDAEACARLAASGVTTVSGAMIGSATGRSDVERVTVVSLDDGALLAEIACDTVVLATGAVPVVELFDVAGAATVFAPERGGHVPLIGPDGETTVPMLFGAGDCTGVSDERFRDPAIAAAEGVRAAAAVARALDKAAPSARPVPTAQPEGQGGATRREVWARASLAVAGTETLICQCEEVGVADLLGLKPPRYLGCGQVAGAARDLLAFAAEGQLNQDHVKRLTRAGMGACQGRRCREQVGAVLAAATGTPAGAIPLPSYRAPVRPLPLSAFGDAEEAPAIAENWEGWFGIESQWIPYWRPLPDEAGSGDVR